MVKSYKQPLVYKPNEALVQNKIDLLVKNKLLLEVLKEAPSQYTINRLDLIDRLLTRLYKKAAGAGTPTTSCEYYKFFNNLSITHGGRENE